jgi:hypothetical protein
MFVVAWLNLALQPCAMAFDGPAEPDCPRCPPSDSPEVAHHDMAGHDMAGHEMASGDMPCLTVAADCSLDDELNYDGRAVKLELKDLPNDLPIAIHPAIALAPSMRAAEYVGRHRTRSPPRGSSTPLNVLYCVYLD